MWLIKYERREESENKNDIKLIMLRLMLRTGFCWTPWNTWYQLIKWELRYESAWPVGSPAVRLRNASIVLFVMQSGSLSPIPKPVDLFAPRGSRSSYRGPRTGDSTPYLHDLAIEPSVTDMIYARSQSLVPPMMG